LIVDEPNKAIGLGLIESKQYLAAADHIQHVIGAEANVTSYYQAIREGVEGPAGNRFQPSRLIDALLNLDPSVVFTTNYDRLFEVAARQGFSVHSFDSNGIKSDLRSGEPVIVKIHGTTDSINDVVLTHPDYARVMKASGEAFDVLKALSSTATILFVGYSLDDPDIQLVLQAVGRGRMSPEAHFLLASEPESPSRAAVFQEAFGVSLLAYPTDQHELLTSSIEELGDRVLAAREARVSPPG
jgi:hypothetical protein